jgi:hypothetical protein
LYEIGWCECNERNRRIEKMTFEYPAGLSDKSVFCLNKVWFLFGDNQMAKKQRRTNLVAVHSSSIHHVGYDRDTQRLFLNYEGGRLYEYFGVPDDVYVRLMNATSIGRFVNYAIKPHYHYKEIQHRPAWVEE